MTSKKRLIDKEKLLEKLTWLAKNEDQFRQSVIGGVMHTIAVTPEVDAVEVVHGRWIGDGWGSYIKRCSVCRSVPLREVGGRHDACYSNYCPNCGARMKEDESSDE